MDYSVAQYPGLTNGTLTVSNLLTGFPYSVVITGTRANTYTNYFPTNETGTVDASTNQAMVVGAVIFPQGANGTNGINSFVYPQISTNSVAPAPLAGFGIFWASNYDLYWVTPTKTNLVVLGH